MTSHPCIKPQVQLEYSVSQQLAFPRQQGRTALYWTSRMQCQGSQRWAPCTEPAPWSTSLWCSTEQQDMAQGGTAPSSPPLLWKGRAGLCSCSTVGRGQQWSNMGGGGTFANEHTSSEIFLKGHIDNITYYLSFFWRCPCTFTTKRSSVTPNCSAVLSSATLMAITRGHSTALMSFVVWFSLLFRFFSFKWQLLSVFFFWLFAFSSFLLSFWLGICWHLAVKPARGAN